MIVLTGQAVKVTDPKDAAAALRNIRPRRPKSPTFIPNPFLITIDDNSREAAANRRNSNANASSVQSSVDAIIERALAATRDADSLPVENCIPATALLESSLAMADLCNNRGGDSSLNCSSDCHSPIDEMLSAEEQQAKEPQHNAAESSLDNSFENCATDDFDDSGEDRITTFDSKTISAAGSTQCRLCKKHFRKKSALDSHMTEQHPDYHANDLPGVHTAIVNTPITPIARLHNKVSCGIL